MTDYVNRQVESCTPSDQQQRRPDDQKFDDDVEQKEGDGWLSEDAVDCQVSEHDTQYYFKYRGTAGAGWAVVETARANGRCHPPQYFLAIFVFTIIYLI